MDRITQLSGARFCGVCPPAPGSLPGLRAAPIPRLRSGPQGVKPWWQRGPESLPPSLPPGVPSSESTRLARKELSLPAICKTGAGEGEEGGEEEGGREEGGSRLQGDSARNPLPRDLAPGPPAPKEALPSPGSCSLPPPSLRPPALCPQEGGLQDFQPSLGCLLSFSKPSSRGRREPCQDKSPSPTAPAGPLSQPPFSCPPPPAPLPNFFPVPILAPAPPSPTSIGSQVPSSGWRGQVGPRFPARRWERQTPQADTETCRAPARLPAWRPPHRKTWPQVHPGRWLRGLSRPGRELVPGAPAEPGSRLWAAGARPRGTLRGGGKVFRALARFCPAGLLYNNHHLSGSQAAGVSAEARMPASAPPPGPGRGLHQDGGVGAARE